ncbi:hypothetical protein [Candidatus Accumulibacter phosphatis]|uniref:hypothetical protein n=1 Tax=Candidatus Accumulibacter phosphatis TaxID=327160 RepID=UPI002C3C8219|nr:hypothetical protein [Accumulibacter sp.]
MSSLLRVLGLVRHGITLALGVPVHGLAQEGEVGAEVSAGDANRQVRPQRHALTQRQLAFERIRAQAGYFPTVGHDRSMLALAPTVWPPSCCERFGAARRTAPERQSAGIVSGVAGPTSRCSSLLSSGENPRPVIRKLAEPAARAQPCQSQ